MHLSFTVKVGTIHPSAEGEVWGGREGGREGGGGKGGRKGGRKGGCWEILVKALNSQQYPKSVYVRMW